MKKYTNLLKQEPLYSIYHENSKLHSSFIRKINNLYNPEYPPYKEYHNVEEIPLRRSNKDNIKVNALSDCLQYRKSCRSFDESIPVNLDQLSVILASSFGITHRLAGHEFRAYPSAGAKYPIELYLFANNVKDLKKGVYHYSPRKDQIELINHNYSLHEATSDINQSIIEKSSCLIVLTSVFARTYNKYFERGYRFCLIEAGHIGQNIALVATSLGLGVCNVAGFIDDHINQALVIDGVEESAVYMVAIGNEKNLVASHEYDPYYE